MFTLKNISINIFLASVHQELKQGLTKQTKPQAIPLKKYL